MGAIRLTAQPDNEARDRHVLVAVPAVDLGEFTLRLSIPILIKYLAHVLPALLAVRDKLMVVGGSPVSAAR